MGIRGMRPKLFVNLFVALALAACSDASKPPAGHWQGLYEGNDIMVAARLEIPPEATIRVSAPDALNDDFGKMPPADREAVRQRLLTSLETGWPSVGSRPFTFDGKIFRNPGGVAPQMEWDAATKTMTVIVYPGTRASVRVPLSPVEKFD